MDQNKLCLICGYQMVLKPAGTSKKPPYKPYGAFWSCSSGDRTHSENITPPPPPVQAQPAPTPQPQYMPPSVAPRPMVQPPQDYLKIEEDKQLRIARESVLSTLSNVMQPQEDLVSGAYQLIEAANILIDYVYNGKQLKDEGLSDEEIEEISKEIIGAKIQQ